MLTQEQLTEALHEGLKHANPPCSRFCTAGAEVVDGERYRFWHNGINRVDGDDQFVYAEAVKNFNAEKLSQRITVWAEGQHRRECVDLNAALEAGAPWVDPCVWRRFADGLTS